MCWPRSGYSVDESEEVIMNIVLARMEIGVEYSE
jgi:hypothetical protein